MQLNPEPDSIRNRFPSESTLIASATMLASVAGPPLPKTPQNAILQPKVPLPANVVIIPFWLSIANS